jgi:putative aminopeptidase FrvX
LKISAQQLREGAEQYLSEFLDLVKRLSEVPGVSGYEQRVAELFKAELEDYVDEITVDPIGNVIATKRGAGDGKRVMVDAHTDEAALNVKYIDDDGFIRVDYVGMPLLQALPFERVDVHGRLGPVLGVVGAPGFHVYFMEMGGPKGPEKPPRLRDLFVDIGASSRKEAEEMGVYIGAPVTLHRKVEMLGGRLITGKALDNRALCAVAIEAVRRLKNLKHDATIHCVGAVQEEVGLRGAGAAAFRLDPDLAIILDVAIPGDYPGVEFRDFPLRVGGGACIGVKDMAWDFAMGNVAHPRILQLMTKAAEQEHIPYQLENVSGTCTDSAKIVVTGKGIPCGKIAVATRYTHTGSEVLSLDDLESATRLLVASLTRIHGDFNLSFL